MIILYKVPGAVVQVPLNTEGLEAIDNNKSHFKRRHLAEFLLLKWKEGTWNLAGLERGNNNSGVTRTCFTSHWQITTPFKTSQQTAGSGVVRGPSGLTGLSKTVMYIN